MPRSRRSHRGPLTQRLRQPGIALHHQRPRARKFRYEAPAGNIGINIGVAAPMAYFPFSGWKDSFLGVLHGQGRDGVEFYTENKVVVERWSRQETRKVLSSTGTPACAAAARTTIVLREELKSEQAPRHFSFVISLSTGFASGLCVSSDN